MGENVIASADISGEGYEMSAYLIGIADRLSDDDDLEYGEYNLTIRGTITADISGGGFEIAKYLDALGKRVLVSSKGAGKLTLKLVSS